MDSPENIVVCEQTTPFVRALAMQSSSRNCSPAPDSVFLKLNCPRVFFSKGVFFHRYRYLSVGMLLFYALRAGRLCRNPEGRMQQRALDLVYESCTGFTIVSTTRVSTNTKHQWMFSCTCTRLFCRLLKLLLDHPMNDILRLRHDAQRYDISPSHYIYIYIYMYVCVYNVCVYIYIYTHTCACNHRTTTNTTNTHSNCFRTRRLLWAPSSGARPGPGSCQAVVCVPS